MDALSALVAELLAVLRATVAPEFCPGGWAWATTVLGLAVGLLPALGAVLGARLRRHAGDGLAPAVAGLVTAALLPWLAFVAAGQVFAAAAAGDGVPGLARADLRDLGRAECFGVDQDAYLGGSTVSAAFSPDRPLLLAMVVLAFTLLPLFTALFAGGAARLALRGGPRWAVKLFWLPLLALPFLAAGSPAGSSAHLWLGMSGGALAGVLVALVARPAPARPRVPDPVPLPPPAAQPAAPRPTAGPVRTPAPARPAVAVRAADLKQGVRKGWQERVSPQARRVSDRLAERFAARTPAAPVVLAPERAPAGAPRRPTLLLSEQRRPLGPTRAVTQGGPKADGTPRFRLVRRLGAGGFGRVWLAEDARRGHLVALKAAHAPDDDTEERIRREAKALAAAGHPSCVRIFDLVHARSDAGLAEMDGLVIVMEYVAGSSLAQHVRDHGVLDDVVAARVWAALADGLGAAHRRGVLHRDVKPGNVIVDEAGRAHLIDFGIARTSGDATLTLAGWILGTPDFLAPEVAGGGSATPASDAWQLAATLSYAMTGHPPRGGRTDVQSGLRAAATGAPLTHLPQRTAHGALLRAALATDPRQRPSLPEVHAALTAWLDRAAPQSPAPAPR
ncbi:serine/threonine-protein kinase [Pseudonocardia sp.]|uniref:serine/threonine-protein kinase n=1 Tax=Pseudonocardia sp. TaxID=60912 RepID=UPI003D12E647